MIYWVIAILLWLLVFSHPIYGFFMDRTLDRWEREDQESGYY